MAYVFWHWARSEVATTDYEDRQRGFHAALRASPSAGFVDCFSLGVSDAPWTAGSESYEDWYLVQDFGALGLLNEAAVSGSRAVPHDVAAAVAAGGAAGVYGLRRGAALRQPRYAHWFGKPEGRPYRRLLDELANVVRPKRKDKGAELAGYEEHENEARRAGTWLQDLRNIAT